MGRENKSLLYVPSQLVFVKICVCLFVQMKSWSCDFPKQLSHQSFLFPWGMFLFSRSVYVCLFIF